MTIICTQCQTKNKKGAVECSHCGALLDATISVTTEEARQRIRDAVKAAKQEAITDKITSSTNDETADAPPASRDAKADEVASGKVAMTGNLELKVLGKDTIFKIAGEALREVVIGRRDTATDFIPLVDLTEAGGRQEGVSRRHATISRRDGVLVITDHQSKNGTFVNGKQLMPEQAQVLRDADVLSFGTLKVLVTYRR